MWADTETTCRPWLWKQLSWCIQVKDVNLYLHHLFNPLKWRRLLKRNLLLCIKSTTNDQKKQDFILDFVSRFSAGKSSLPPSSSAFKIEKPLVQKQRNADIMLCVGALQLSLCESQLPAALLPSSYKRNKTCNSHLWLCQTHRLCSEGKYVELLSARPPPSPSDKE